MSPSFILSVLTLCCVVGLSAADCSTDPLTLFAQRANTSNKYGLFLLHPSPDLADAIDFGNSVFTNDATYEVSAVGRFGPGIIGVVEYLLLVNPAVNLGWGQILSEDTLSFTPAGPDNITAVTLSSYTFANRSVTLFNKSVTTLFQFAPCSPLLQNVYVILDEEVTFGGMYSASIDFMCSNIQRFCTGPNQQYSDFNDCITFFRTLPVQACNDDNSFKGNSVACRVVHLFLAKIRPEIHCQHVGKASIPCQASACPPGAQINTGTTGTTEATGNSYHVVFNNNNAKCS